MALLLAGVGGLQDRTINSSIALHTINSSVERGYFYIILLVALHTIDSTIILLVAPVVQLVTSKPSDVGT